MNALIVFQNITLIDGTGREPLPEATVAVREHQIIYAGKAKRWQPSLEEDILNLDFSGKYLLPGLIDCHVHLAGSGEPDGRFHADDGAMALRMLNNTRKNLAAGITTVRDCGGWNELEFAVRAAVQRGEFTGPRLLLAGRFLSTSESGATQYPGMYRIARGVEGVRKAVREQIRHGADLVKMGVTGAVLIEDDAAGDTHFNSEEIGGAVAEAAKSDRRVAAHAHGIEGIRRAVFAGAHSIEHGTYLHEGPDVIEEMRRRGTFLVPTLKAARDVVKGDASKLPAWMLDKTREAQEAARKSIRLAYHAGVPIAMGSDASSPFNYHGENGLEVDCMRQAGIKPMDALVSSTLTAAKALGLDSQVGSIEEGKRADLLILDANPLEDLKRLADKKLIRAVFQDGKLVARQPGDVYPRTILARDSLTVGQ